MQCGSVMQEVTPCGTSQRAPIWWPSTWLRRTPTLAMPKMDIQAAIWHSPRASRLSGSAIESGRWRRSRRIASRASASLTGWGFTDQSASMA